MSRRLWMMFGISACGALMTSSWVQAQEQMLDRWKQEWIQQHPGQPVPNMGVLEHMHESEIIANMNAGFAQMRQARQAELQRQYQLSRQRQEQILASQHITWSAQQWQAWNTAYDRQKQQEAQDYIRASALSGEMAREEAAQDARRRELGY